MREGGEKSSLVEQEIQEGKKKVERHNRERDKDKEASETKGYESGAQGQGGECEAERGLNMWAP